MKCPYCGSESSRVVDSRPSEDLNAIRRRRHLGNGILVGVHRLRREGHAVVVEEVTLGDFDPRQAVVDGFELV